MKAQSDERQQVMKSSEAGQVNRELVAAMLLAKTTHENPEESPLLIRHNDIHGPDARMMVLMLVDGNFGKLVQRCKDCYTEKLY